MRTDEEIRDDVIDELEWEPKVDATEVGVTVKDGAVTLLGTVRSYAEKLAAEQATKRVKGVRAIAENIEVRLPSDMAATDESIAEQIAHILEWDTTIPNASIQAEIRKGFVTLTGEVPWNYQREKARKIVADVRGVNSVSNQIRVKSPSLPRADITREITRALHRNADIEAAHIKVSTAGGRVTLDGSVRAFYERKLVEDAVWSAPGVTQVIDNLRVAQPVEV